VSRNWDRSPEVSFLFLALPSTAHLFPESHLYLRLPSPISLYQLGKTAIHLKEPKISQHWKAPSCSQTTAKQKFQEARTQPFFKAEVLALRFETVLFLFFLQVHMPQF